MWTPKQRDFEMHPNEEVPRFLNEMDCLGKNLWDWQQTERGMVAKIRRKCSRTLQVIDDLYTRSRCVSKPWEWNMYWARQRETLTSLEPEVLSPSVHDICRRVKFRRWRLAISRNGALTQPRKGAEKIFWVA